LSEDVAGLRDRLEDLGRRLGAWNATVNSHFQKLWSFNSAPKGQFEPSLRDAARIAEERAGQGPRDEGYKLLAEVCDLYARADESTRAELTTTVKASDALAVLCIWFGGKACQELEATGRADWLRRAVTAAALVDTGPDYRDWYLTLGEVWRTAVRHGLDPRGAFAAAAAIAPEQRDYGGGSTRKMLAEFEASAYFAESVAPALPRQDAQDEPRLG
jgi:hypothetical protein